MGMVEAVLRVIFCGLVLCVLIWLPSGNLPSIKYLMIYASQDHALCLENNSTPKRRLSNKRDIVNLQINVKGRIAWPFNPRMGLISRRVLNPKIYHSLWTKVNSSCQYLHLPQQVNNICKWGQDKISSLISPCHTTAPSPSIAAQWMKKKRGGTKKEAIQIPPQTTIAVSLQTTQTAAMSNKKAVRVRLKGATEAAWAGWGPKHPHHKAREGTCPARKAWRVVSRQHHYRTEPRSLLLKAKITPLSIRISPNLLSSPCSMNKANHNTRDALL